MCMYSPCPGERYMHTPITGGERVAYAGLLALLVAGFVLHRWRRPRPRPVLRAYAVAGALAAFGASLVPQDWGATPDHGLWQWVIAPAALVVFAVHAELWKRDPPPLPVARVAHAESTTSSAPTTISPA